MATLTIDGKVIEAPGGAPLVEVLKKNGFYTPNLCYIDGLKPYAGCRTCLVDVQGPPGLQLSCTSLVQDGMVVITESDDDTVPAPVPEVVTVREGTATLAAAIWATSRSPSSFACGILQVPSPPQVTSCVDGL